MGSRAEAKNRGVIIREINETEIPALLELAYKIWREHYPDIISREQIEYMLALMYSDEAIRGGLREGKKFLVAHDVNEMTGFLGYEKTAPHEVFIHKLYVDSRYQGKGIGRKLLAEIERMFPEHSLLLNVNRINYKSINFYFKLGFEIIEVIDREIGDGYFMNDFVMRKG